MENAALGTAKRVRKRGGERARREGFYVFCQVMVFVS